MVDLTKLSESIKSACEKTVIEFIDSNHEVKIIEIESPVNLEDIFGPSIEVAGEKLRYTVTMQYKVEQNKKYIELLTQKYPFIDTEDLPELDLLDLLGEYLNILCGKINKDFENVDDNLNIEIPFFTYGLENFTDNLIKSIECEFGELSFKLHYQLS